MRVRVAHSLGKATQEGQERLKLRAVEIADVVPRPRSEARVFVRLHSQSGTDLACVGTVRRVPLVGHATQGLVDALLGIGVLWVIGPGIP